MIILSQKLTLSLLVEKKCVHLCFKMYKYVNNFEWNLVQEKKKKNVTNNNSILCCFKVSLIEKKERFKQYIFIIMHYIRFTVFVVVELSYIMEANKNKEWFLFENSKFYLSKKNWGILFINRNS